VRISRRSPTSPVRATAKVRKHDDAVTSQRYTNNRVGPVAEVNGARGFLHASGTVAVMPARMTWTHRPVTLADGTVVYTEGACSGNPGPGGWAWATAPDGCVRAAGGEAHTTNQRMEVLAAFDAVRTLPGRLLVVSDSTYVVNCFAKRWYSGWARRGWRTVKGQPVANRDLWEPFVELVLTRGDVSFQWVKGSSGSTVNDLVDYLAAQAAAQYRH
jgi:ribonuclease HI